MGLNPERLGRTISEIRKTRGLTQRQVAERSGLTVNYLSLLETGQRGASVDVVNLLAEALGVPSEIIMFLAGNGELKHGNADVFAPIAEATKQTIRGLIRAESSVK